MSVQRLSAFSTHNVAVATAVIPMERASVLVSKRGTTRVAKGAHGAVGSRMRGLRPTQTADLRSQRTSISLEVARVQVAIKLL